MCHLSYKLVFVTANRYEMMFVTKPKDKNQRRTQGCFLSVGKQYCMSYTFEKLVLVQLSLQIFYGLQILYSLKRISAKVSLENISSIDLRILKVIATIIFINRFLSRRTTFRRYSFRSHPTRARLRNPQIQRITTQTC